MNRAAPSMHGLRPHSSDEAIDRLISRSIRFAAFFRKGPLEKYRIDCATLAEARAAADRLTAQHGQWGRRAMVYGISSEGWTTPIPPGFPDIPTTERR
jgi:hypothetical protein